MAQVRPSSKLEVTARAQDGSWRVLIHAAHGARKEVQRAGKKKTRGGREKNGKKSNARIRIYTLFGLDSLLVVIFF
jgi:hypothetical protein